MKMFFHQRIYRAGAFCLLTCSVCSASLGGLLLVGAFTGGPGDVGEILLVSFGILLLLMSGPIFVLSVNYLKSSKWET